ITAFVSSLRSSATLAPVHDVSVLVVTLDPAPVGIDGQSQVLPLVKAVRLQIVVADVGNEAEKRVPVVATLTIPGAQPQSVRDFVDLTPGQRATVTLGGLHPDAVPATLTVQAGPVAGESVVADNGKAIGIVF